MARTGLRKIKCPQDLNIVADYETGDDTITFDVIANAVGTITSTTTTGLTSVVIEVNSTPVTVPFALTLADTVEITFDPAGADGNVELSGTY